MGCTSGRSEVAKTKRLLIVEDEERLRRSVSRYLESHGIEVTQAGSLEEARSYLDAGAFDAVVLDVGLPDGDGLALLPLAGVQRAVVVTANPEPKRFRDCGVRHHLAKPLDLRELHWTVEALQPA